MSQVAKKPRVSLTNQILIATLVGLVLGTLVGPKIAGVKVIGDIFLRLIQMSVPIIIIGAVTEAVGSLNPKDLGKLGFKMFVWFLVPTVLAAGIGWFLATIIQPGVGLPEIQLATEIKPVPQDMQTVILNFFPVNIVRSLAEGSMIQVMVFALMLGAALSMDRVQEDDSAVFDLIKKGNRIVLRVIKIVMNIAPLGVGALMAWVAGVMGLQIIIPLIKYLGVMAIGVTIIMTSMILITAARCKVNPIKLAGKLTDMSVVAATTTSSAISLPIKMADSVGKLGVSERISNLVNPLGMVLNSTGQALFLSVASMMIAQFFKIDLSAERTLQIIVISTLACMGTLAVPGGALVIFASIMPTLGFPVEGIALIAGVDWFRGAITTIPNVACDALVALIIAKDEGEFNRDIFDGKITIDEYNAQMEAAEASA